MHLLLVNGKIWKHILKLILNYQKIVPKNKLCNPKHDVNYSFLVLIEKFVFFYQTVVRVYYILNSSTVSNKTPTLWKSINMDIWVFGTLSKLFVQVSLTETKFSSK